jgi:hypothetical protein
MKVVHAHKKLIQRKNRRTTDGELLHIPADRFQQTSGVDAETWIGGTFNFFVAGKREQRLQLEVTLDVNTTYPEIVTKFSQVVKIKTTHMGRSFIFAWNFRIQFLFLSSELQFQKLNDVILISCGALLFKVFLLLRNFY